MLLIKFCVCCDVCCVMGDVMEVCGGIGYIEEWSDVWFVCDVYFGLIWEGISNIVVFDVVCVV